MSTLDHVISETASRERLAIRKEELEIKQRYATAFARSGCFADIKGSTQEEAIAKALVKIELGEAMGFTPAESMTGIDIIQGRVAVGANLRAARMQRSGYSWRMDQLDEKGCRLTIFRAGEELGTSTFTLEDATRAGLSGKDNYKKNPRNMYFARAITNAQRWYAPGVLGVDVLSTEEAIDLGAVVTETERKTSEKADQLRERLAAMRPEPEPEREVVMVGAMPDGTFALAPQQEA